jgi:uncharacterized RDD family membrane protein YckC
MTRTNTLLIKTPEGVVFSQTLAGPVTRFLAWLIDFVFQTVLLRLIGFALFLVMIVTPEGATTIWLLLHFVVTIGYSIAFEWFWRGQTPGKKLLRIRVVDGTGLRLRFSQVAMRNLLRFVDSPPLPFEVGNISLMLPTFYLVGGPIALLTRKAQRLGDIAANTVVVRIPRIVEPNLEQLGADKYNSLRAHPHICARLRQRVTPVEASTALQAVIRRDEFEAVARVQLFGELAEHFKSKVDFPADALEGIADEQFVRNVVDVLYRTETKRGASPSPAKERPPDAGALVA